MSGAIPAVTAARFDPNGKSADRLPDGVGRVYDAASGFLLHQLIRTAAGETDAAMLSRRIKDRAR